jgi:putative membrane protein
VSSLSSTSTEELARRYRSLFSLPSSASLVAYLGVSAVVLALSFDRLHFDTLMTLLGLAATFASAVVLQYLIKAVEPSSIATLRRVSAMVLSGTLIWLFAAAAELIYASLFKSTQNLATIAFGAFLVCAFEFVVINGAFVEKTRFAGPLSIVHPALVFLWSGPLARVSILGVGAGAIIVALAFAFIYKLKAIRTLTNDSAIHTLQAFLKTWAAHNPEELERALSRYSVEESVGTRVIKFEMPKKQPTLVLSGIHPGPFFPVGSYNLPELFFEKFDAKQMTALTMHRPGGHEKNLPTRDECIRYANETATLAASIQTKNQPADMRGPILAKIDDFSAACVALGNQALVMVSSSPLSSDDITYSVEGKLASVAKEFGFDVSIVDAHNSIGSKRVKLEITSDRPWRDLIERLRREEEHEFRIGFAHSSEAEFSHGPDISDAGVGVLTFEVEKTKWVLVLVDSNNANPGAKEEVKRKLESAGFRLMELCTSDSHNLAARGVAMERGYFALGEATPISDVASYVVKLAQIAESRLSYRRYGTGEFVSKVHVFGTKAIEDFALLARRASTFAKRFVTMTVPLTLVLLILTIVL